MNIESNNGPDLTGVKIKEVSDTTNLSGFTNPSMVKGSGNLIELEVLKVKIFYLETSYKEKQIKYKVKKSVFNRFGRSGR